MYKNVFRKGIAIVLSVASVVFTGCGNAAIANRDATVNGNDYVKVTTNKYQLVAYELTDNRNYGATTFYRDKVDFEGYCGIRLDTTGDKIKYAVYHHTLKNIDTKNVDVNLYNMADGKLIKKIDTMSIPDGQYDSEWRTFPDTLSDGIYKFESAFPYIPDNTFMTANGYVYIKNGVAKTCRLTRNERIADSSKMDKVTVGKNPKNYLSNAKNTYPTNGTNGSCNHVKLWEKKADEILKERHLENASDEAKVFFFAEWLRQNIAYDKWRVEVNDNHSRAMKYNDWNNDNLWTYYNGVGQCWDFTNILTIMCRHVGIPCTDISNNTHTVACVYMRDRWYAIDASAMTLYTNWDENPDPKNYKGPGWGDGMCDDFGYYEQTMNQFDVTIWEPKNNGLGKGTASQIHLDNGKQYEWVFEPEPIKESENKEILVNPVNF